MSLTEIRSILSVRVARKTFAKNKVPVLENVAFDVPKGSFVSVLGESGCGKSTLLRMIAGLDRNYDGEICWNRAGEVASDDILGFVFQEPRLLGWKTVEENIAFALHPVGGHCKNNQKLDQALDLVGLTSSRKLWPSQLSGGMAKRVSIARAMIGSPSLLLLDEPFSTLDFGSKAALWDKLETIHRSQNLTTVMVTHDLEEALYLSDIVFFLEGTPATLQRVARVNIARPRLNFLNDVSSKRNEMLKGSALS